MNKYHEVVRTNLDLMWTTNIEEKKKKKTEAKIKIQQNYVYYKKNYIETFRNVSQMRYYTKDKDECVCFFSWANDAGTSNVVWNGTIYELANISIGHLPVVVRANILKFLLDQAKQKIKHHSKDSTLPTTFSRSFFFFGPWNFTGNEKYFHFWFAKIYKYVVKPVKSMNI